MKRYEKHQSLDDVSVKFERIAQGKGITRICFFSFADLKKFGWRPCYRIDRHTIKRDCRKCCSIVVSNALTICLVWDGFVLRVRFRSQEYLKGILDLTLCVVGLSGNKWL